MAAKSISHPKNLDNISKRPLSFSIVNFYTIVILVSINEHTMFFMLRYYHFLKLPLRNPIEKYIILVIRIKLYAAVTAIVLLL